MFNKTKKAEEYQLKGGGALNPLPTKTVSKTSGFFKTEVVTERKPLTTKTLPPVIKPGMALPKYDEEQEEIQQEYVQEEQLPLEQLQLEQSRLAQVQQLGQIAKIQEQQRLKELQELKLLEELALEEKQRQEQIQKQEAQQKRQAELAELKRLEQHRLEQEKIKKAQELETLRLEQERQKQEELAEKQRLKELVELEKQQKEEEKRLEKLAKIQAEQELKAEQERQKQEELAEKQRLRELAELEKQKKEEQKHLEKLALEKKQKQQAQLDSVHQSQQKQKITPVAKKLNNTNTTSNTTKPIQKNIAPNESKIQEVQKNLKAKIKPKSNTNTNENNKNNAGVENSTVSLIRSYFIWWSVACCIMGGIVLSYMYYVANQSFGDSKKMTQEMKSFTIKKGENPFNALNRQEIPTTWTYWFWSKFYNIKAGKYQVRYEDSLFDLLKMMEKGKSVEEKLRFEEGKNIYDLFAYLKNNNNVEHDINNQAVTSENMFVRTVLSNMSLNPEQLDFWGLTNFYNLNQNELMLHHLEGLFFPDTFFVDGLITESKLLKQSFELMQQKMQKVWLAKAENLPYKNPYEALIMASLIEKESGENGERSKISGVFFNRLQKGMPLQTDPTAKYGVQVHQGNHVLMNDFNMYKAVHTQTEYNTYNINGLPPTPICLPSFESLEAALHPAKHDYLYFYASSKNGKTSFSKTLEEHNQKIQADK